MSCAKIPEKTILANIKMYNTLGELVVDGQTIALYIQYVYSHKPCTSRISKVILRPHNVDSFSWSIIKYLIKAIL